jgi:hypothetical protein
MYVVVPDGVTSIRARLPRQRWRTFPVEQNVVVLPEPAFYFEMVR